MFCGNCGTRNTPDANFCKHCGQKLDNDHAHSLSEDDFQDMKPAEESVGELLALAFAKEQKGDMAAAIESCEKALKLMPNSTSAHSLLGMLYKKQGEREKAIAEYEKVLELNPGSIADRETLEELRANAPSDHPKVKVISTRVSRRLFLDTPTGAAVIGVALFVIVIFLFGWVALKHGEPTNKPDTDTFGTPITTDNAPAIKAYRLPAQNYSSVPSTSAMPNTYATAPQSAVGYPGTQAAPPQQPAYYPPNGYAPPPQVMRPVYQPPVQSAPKPVEIMPTQPINPSQSTNQTSVHLSDTGNSANNSNGANGNHSSSPGQSKPEGRIKIIVGPANGSNTTSPSPGGSSISTSVDSRSLQNIATHYQLEGSYQRAVNTYLKAMDGAGDEAPGIYQQIAICYQHLGEKNQARSNYDQAISGYKALITAGRKTDWAKRGIQACEAGLRIVGE
ncbi:MAG: tetratricopeptide repeat protein [Armatimonadetes bacterium]|nr:tetratricopeptide repeat protein [Armatimonadota bacterium]